MLMLTYLIIIPKARFPPAESPTITIFFGFTSSEIMNITIYFMNKVYDPIISLPTII